MRLFPAQMAVQLICGNNLPPFARRSTSIKACIKEGRAQLVCLTKVDFGYDLQRWHDHLKVTRDGGYTWNRTIKLPKIMAAALESESWQRAVAELIAEEAAK